MSHRRESGAVPPWVVVETKETPTKQIEAKTPQLSAEIPSDNKSSSNHTPGKTHLPSGDQQVLQELDPLQCLHITGGEVVNADGTQRLDLFIVNGRVTAMAAKLKVPKGCPTLDASGLLIMPGGVDIATYIQSDLFGFDAASYENTTKEALLGGTTTIIDTVICPKGRLPYEVFTEIRNRVKDVPVWCNVVYRVGIVEINPSVLEQMERLVKHAQINSFLFFISAVNEASNNGGITLEQLRSALEKCRQLGVVAYIRIGSRVPTDKTAFEALADETAEMETKLFEQVLNVVEETNCPIVLTSPQQTGTILRTVRARRQLPPLHVQVSCTPSTLLPLTGHGKQNPSPFLSHLTVGDIGNVSSDQFGGNQVTGSARLGAIGQRMVAVWEAAVPNGWLDASSFVNVVSSNAARATGLYPLKGRISPGSDADLVLWPAGSAQHVGTGRPIVVLLHGKLMAREGKLANHALENNPALTIDHHPVADELPQPQGLYLDVKPFPSAIYDAVHATDRMRIRYQYLKNRGPWAMGALQDELKVTSKEVQECNQADCTSTLPAGTLTATAEKPSEIQKAQTQSPTVRMVHGHRDLHASGFSLSGAQVDDNQPLRSGIRTSQPPGGISRNPLW